MEEMYAALRMCACEEKTTFLGKDDLTTYSEINQEFWHERQRCMVPRLWPYCGRHFLLVILLRQGLAELALIPLSITPNHEPTQLN